MSLPVRLAAVVLGLAAVVYGTASMTGCWLGTPSWLVPISAEEWLSEHHPGATWPNGAIPRPGDVFWSFRESAGRGIVTNAWRIQSGDIASHKWISVAVVAAGVALTAFGAWPRRRRAGVSP